MGWEADAMRFLPGFMFGAFYIGNRAFRVAFLLIILITVCLYQMSSLLATIGELLCRERRPLNQIIVPCCLLPTSSAARTPWIAGRWGKCPQRWKTFA